MPSPQGMSAEERVMELVMKGETDWNYHIIPMVKEIEAAARADERKIIQHECSSTMVPKDVLPDMVKLVQRIANGRLAEVFSDSEENEVVAADILARAGIERVANANFIKKKNNE